MAISLAAASLCRERAAGTTAARHALDIWSDCHDQATARRPGVCRRRPQGAVPAQRRRREISRSAHRKGVQGRQSAKAQVEAAKRQNDAAERALTGVRNEAMAGQRTTQDVLNAEQALVNARQSLLVAQHDRVVASFSLLSAVGRLSARELKLPVEIYDPQVHYHQVRDTWFGLRTPSGD